MIRPYNKILAFALTLLLLGHLFGVQADKDIVGSEERPAQESSLTDAFTKDPKYLLAKAPKAFTQNQGQIKNHDIRFTMQGSGLWFTDDGVWFDIKDGNGKAVILKQGFVDANLVRPQGKEPMGYYSNFFYGNDPMEWKTQVSNFKEIFYEDLWDGIDLRYYTNGDGLKYDFIVHPGADIDQIRIRYEGANGLTSNDEGYLVIDTAIGEIKDKDLFIYQDQGRTTIKGCFKLHNDFEYGFEISDEYLPDEILVIDPLLDFSTFLGGIDDDNCADVAIGPMGDVFVTGDTLSNDFPTVPGAYDEIFNVNIDSFVSKISSDGSSLLYSTYIGGSDKDISYDLEIDTQGYAFITGYSKSADFPTTVGAYDEIWDNKEDVFILKLNSSGSSISFSTFVGGDQKDIGYALSVDPSGNVSVTGLTQSADFPTTAGVYDEIYNADRDIFILKLSANGSSLLYSTFFGELGKEEGFAIAVDLFGNTYVTGYTDSPGFPTTVGAYDTTLSANKDVFVLKLSANGSSLNYSTYVGGSDRDEAHGISLDTNGNVFVTGFTKSIDFPTTVGAFDTSYSNGLEDVFVFKLNTNASSLIYSTYIGGDDSDKGFDILTDEGGNAYITGLTKSTDFPTTPGAFDETPNGLKDVFLVQMHPNGSTLHYSTLVGGSNDDEGHAIAMEIPNDIYISGSTKSIDFPTTSSANDTSHNGGKDAFVLKFTLSFFNVTSLEVLKEELPVSTIYTRYCTYTFRVNVTSTTNLSNLDMVHLRLDPLGSNIQLLWNRSSGQFIELFDPLNYIELIGTSNAWNDTYSTWTIDFDIIFNWTYPNEIPQSTRADAISAFLPTTGLNAQDLFTVENDLQFTGTLSVKDEMALAVNENDVVKGGEVLTWTGLTPVYEGTSDVFPPPGECGVTVWDSEGRSWTDPSTPGVAFDVDSVVALNTNTVGDMHTVNITGIPAQNDQSDVTFTIKIDGDNVTFSGETPGNTTWQTDSNVNVGITITDIGGGIVNGSTISYRTSIDNGSSFDPWTNAGITENGDPINVFTDVELLEGNNNLVQWRGKDSVGNGPKESKSYRVSVDTEDPIFSDDFPLSSEVSDTEEVSVGITICDIISGVDPSNIEYTVSTNSGSIWEDWTQVTDLQGGAEVKVTLDLTFSNGTGNRIKWKAYDIAGNGPVETLPYVINVNTWHPSNTPEVTLLTPEDASTITIDHATLSWELEGQSSSGITYDVYLDTIDPPQSIEKTGLTATHILVDGFLEGEPYYWTVVPRDGTITGYCLSGIWSFSYEKNATVPDDGDTNETVPDDGDTNETVQEDGDTNGTVPEVRLISPENGAKVLVGHVQLQWEPVGLGTGWTYSLYFGVDYPPGLLYAEGLESRSMIIEEIEDVGTYYWTVVPLSDKLVNGTYARTVWSFEAMDPGLEIGPVENVTLSPGMTDQVEVEVLNIGHHIDGFIFNLSTGVLGNQVSLIEESESMVMAKFSIQVPISISISNETPIGDYPITFTTWSQNAEELGVDMTKSVTFYVLVVPLADGDGEGDGTGASSDGSESATLFWLLVVVIIAVLIFVFLIMKRKRDAIASKKKKREENKAKVGGIAGPSGGTPPPLATSVSKNANTTRPGASNGKMEASIQPPMATDVPAGSLQAQNQPSTVPVIPSKGAAHPPQKPPSAKLRE